MRYINPNVPVPNRQDTYSQESFSGGLNNRSVNLKDNEASDLLNMTFSDDSLMEKRKGQEAYDTLTLASSVTFTDEYKPYNDVNQLIRATNQDVYAGETLIRSVTGEVSGVNHNGRYFFVDGNKLFVYGKFPQAADTYTVIVGVADPNNLVFEVQSPPVGHAMLPVEYVRGVTHVDYGAKIIWYEPCENEVADTTKGANVIPEKPKYIVSHNGRLFLSGSAKDNDNVFITAVSNGYYFPVTLPMQLPPNSDQVVGLHVYDNSVLVGRTYDIYAITGNTNKPNIGIEMFQLRKLNTHTGFANNSAKNTVHNFLFFLGSDGNAYSLGTTRGDDKNLATVLINNNVDLLEAPIQLTKNTITDSCSIFFDDMWYISVLDKVIIYSYRNKAWTIYKGFDARCFYNLSSTLIWGNVSGKLVRHSADYLDFGKPYQAFWTGKHNDVGSPKLFKQFMEFSVVAYAYDSLRSDIQVSMEIDYNDYKVRDSVTNNLSIWGKARWGDIFTSKNISISLPFWIGRRGRFIRFTFSNWYPLKATYADLAARDAGSGFVEDDLVYVTTLNKYFIYRGNVWVEMLSEDMNQGMKIYQLHLDYEMRGKR